MKLISFILFCGVLANAYVPPTRAILEKTVENSGTASYQIEKEIRFSNPEIPALKETWYVANNKTIRLTVTPLAPAPAGTVNPKYTALYVAGVKYTLSGTSKETGKVPEEMPEQFFHFKRVDSLAQHLNKLGVLNSTQGNLDLARLNRSQGVINFGLGKPGEEGTKGTAPYVWIEQDAFVVKRVRFSQDTEMTANNYQIFPKGLNYPMVTNLTWADQKVRMNTLSVTMVKAFPPTVFQSANLEDSKDFQANFSRWNAVMEFYKRFR